MVNTDLKAGEIHLLYSPVEISESSFQECLEVLTDLELERSERYHFAKDRNQFIVARGILRQILGSYLACTPEQIQIQLGEHGKPFLDCPIHFNVAHSGGHILLAFSRDTEVGVDVEVLRLDKNRMIPLQERICTKNERAAILRLPESTRERALYRLWTAKEAYLKALGTGLQLEPSAIEIDPEILGGSSKFSKVLSVRNTFSGSISPFVQPLPICEERFGASAAFASAKELKVRWIEPLRKDD